jgi:hypothetical protein
MFKKYFVVGGIYNFFFFFGWVKGTLGVQDRRPVSACRQPKLPCHSYTQTKPD